MKKFFFLLIGFILVSLFGCNKDEGPFVYYTGISDSTIMSFSKDIQPVFNSNCVACHTELHAKLNLMPCCSYTQLTSSGYSAPYIDTITPENSNIYKHLKCITSIMPPSGKISEEQISKILLWIKQGGTNN